MKTNLLTKYLLMVAPIIAAPIAIVACGKAPQASASDEKLHSNQKQETKDASKNNDDAIDKSNPLFNPDLSDDAPIVPIEPPQKEQEPKIDPTKPDPKILAKIEEYKKKIEIIYPYVMEHFSEIKIKEAGDNTSKLKQLKNNLVKYVDDNEEFKMYNEVHNWYFNSYYGGIYNVQLEDLKTKIFKIEELINKLNSLIFDSEHK